MVEIVIALDGSGCLSRMNLSGHAGFEVSGTNPACAAITLLARTTSRLVASRTGWIVDGDAPDPGDLSLEIMRRPRDTDDWLLGVTDTLMLALADVEEEFPGAISVRIEERDNGS